MQTLVCTRTLILNVPIHMTHPTPIDTSKKTEPTYIKTDKVTT